MPCGRPRSLVALVVVAAAVAALAVSGAPSRLALALVLVGWWWGSVRLEALDRSVLAPEIGHSAAATVVVTRSGAKDALRDPRSSRGASVRFAHAPGASPARASRRPFAAAGRDPRPARHGRRSSRSGGRLRRTRLAGPPRRSCRAARRRLADRRQARRDRRRLRPASCACCARDRPWAQRRATRGARGNRARRGRGAHGRAPQQLQVLRALPPAGRLGSERRVPRDRRARPRLVARDPPVWQPRSRRSARSAPTSSRSAGNRPSSAPGSPAVWPRSRGCSPARAIAGTSSPWARRFCSRGRRPACSSRASSSPSPLSARSSCCCRGSDSRSRAIRCRPGCAMRSRCRPPAERQRHRSSGCSSGAFPSTRWWRTRSSRLRSDRSSGSLWSAR